MKVGDLVKRLELPYNYGIITSASWRSIRVWWAGDNRKRGYDPSQAYLSFEVINGKRNQNKV